MSPFSPFATLSTTDLNADVSYSLVSGDSLVDNQLFTIVGDQLYVNFFPTMSSVVITPFVSGHRFKHVVDGEVFGLHV